MSHTRSSRSRLALAASVALAVTVGTLTAGGAAVAASGSATGTAVETAASSTAQENAIALLPNSTVIGNGPTGFLTHRQESGGTEAVYRWTRYEDGVTTVLPAGTYQGGVGSDVIVKAKGTTYELYDMATGAAPVAIDTISLGAAAKLVRLAGSTLVMQVPRAEGGVDVHLVSQPAGGSLVDRKVSGCPPLPSTASTAWARPAH